MLEIRKTITQKLFANNYLQNSKNVFRLSAQANRPVATEQRIWEGGSKPLSLLHKYLRRSKILTETL